MYNQLRGRLGIKQIYMSAIFKNIRYLQSFLIEWRLLKIICLLLYSGHVRLLECPLFR